MRPLAFVGSAREDLRAFPDDVRADIGRALNLVQQGRTPESVAPLGGFGSGVAAVAQQET
jgi:phage-related protein